MATLMCQGNDCNLCRTQMLAANLGGLEDIGVQYTP